MFSWNALMFDHITLVNIQAWSIIIVYSPVAWGIKFTTVVLFSLVTTNYMHMCNTAYV